MAKLEISMTPDEVESYLETQRTVRLATSGPDAMPHVVPLWFVWHDGVMFMNSTLGNRTLLNLQRGSRAAGVVDDGEEYDELRGVLLHGRVEAADDDGRIDDVRRKWSEKYFRGNPVPFDRWRKRVWLRLRPTRVRSWDFRKIAQAQVKRKEGAGG